MSLFERRFIMLISKFNTNQIESEVSKFEQQQGIILPVQYRSFLVRYNGGFTPETDFCTENESSDIRAFYGINSEAYSFSKLNLKKWLSKKLLPIACDSFGNMIVISLDDKTGCVYFCNHEKKFAKTKLANDFKGFISCCKSEAMDESYYWTVEEREQSMIKDGLGKMVTDELRQMWQEEYEQNLKMHQEEVVLD